MIVSTYKLCLSQNAQRPQKLLLLFAQSTSDDCKLITPLTPVSKRLNPEQGRARTPESAFVREETLAEIYLPVCGFDPVSAFCWRAESLSQPLPLSVMESAILLHPV